MEPRERTEEIERRTLSPFAVKSVESKGRQVWEPPCSIRTCFQRDRDRIVHSKAFRRLKHKTQVFLIPEGDHFRTRLTHTLEVAQIARTVARALALNEDLTEAIALAHDLGHTPFGHGGEEALREILRPIFPPDGFNHNEQSLRVVDVLEGRESGRGLNLTWEVRDGILNHTGSRMPSTLEAQVVKIADRIAYINHDIDDALRGGILREEDLPAECLEILGRKHSQRINTMVRDVVESSWGKAEIRMSPGVEQATNALRRYLFENVYIGSLAKREEEKAKRMIQHLFDFYRRHPEELYTQDPQSQEFCKTVIETEGLERAICDYIAGMTDRFAISVYERLFVPRSWKQE